MSNAQEEIKCKCGCGLNAFDYRLRKIIIDTEKHFGYTARIHSGNRCPKYNKKIGGTYFSKHMLCVAIDITVDNVNNRALYDYFCDEYEGRYGIILETLHVHFDLREEEYREDKGRKSV